MPPVVAAVGSFFATLAAKGIVAALFATTVGQALVSTAFSVGVNMVFGRKASPGSFDTETGIQTRLQVASTVTRKIIYGRQKTGGSLVYVNEYGTDNEYLDLVIAVADCECEDLHAVYVNGREVTIGGSDEVTEYASGGSDYMWIVFYSGSESQTYSTAVAANSGGEWTSDHRGRGIAWVHVRLRWNPELYPGGIPRFEFVIDGRPLYDPQQDSTVTGGSGLHRYATPSTWTYTFGGEGTNLALQLNDYLRGVELNGVRIAGMGIDEADLPAVDVLAAAAICDESVTLKAGGTEPRYHGGFIADTGNPHRTIVRHFLSGMAGALHDQGGVMLIDPGQTKTAVLTITDDDVAWNKPFEFEPRRGRDEVVNAVSGRYIEPDAQYTDVEYPTRRVAGDEAVDGGQRWTTDLDLLAVQSNPHAQRVAEQFRKRSRAQGKLSFTGSPRLLELEAGDWVEFDSTRYGWTAGSEKTFEVEVITHNPDLSVSLVLQEVPTDLDDWTAASDEITPAGVTATSVPALGAATPGSFGALATRDTITNAEVDASADIALSKINRATDSATRGSSTPIAYTDGTTWIDVASITISNVPTDPLVVINGTQFAWPGGSDAATDAATTADWRIFEDNGTTSGTIVDGQIGFTTELSTVVYDESSTDALETFYTKLLTAAATGSVTYKLQVRVTSSGKSINVQTASAIRIKAI